MKKALLLLFLFGLTWYSYTELYSRGFEYFTFLDILVILLACGLYLPVILKWEKRSPVFQGIFLFFCFTPVIWLLWIINKKRRI